MDPQKGTVHVRRPRDPGQDPDRVVRLGLSHVPEGREVFPLLTVRENLAMGAYTRSDADGVARDMEMVFGYFPVLKRARRAAGRPALGRRAADAGDQPRARWPGRRMMLLDEPSLGLSPKLVKEIFEIIVRINRERGVTVLLVEQNAHMALNIADFGYVLEVGPHRDGGYRARGCSRRKTSRSSTSA